MSIATEITRIQQAKADIKTAIEAKGVTVPSSATIDTYDDYVSQISGGGGLSRNTSGTPYCTGHDLYVDVTTDISIDGGTSWVESGVTTILVESGSSQCVRLPQGYTEVEYITSENVSESVLGPYIDTNYKPTQNTRIVFNYQSTSSTRDYQRIFGSGEFDMLGYLVNLEGAIGNRKYYYKFGQTSNWYTTSVSADLNRHTIDYNNSRQFLVDNTSIATLPNTSFTCTSNLGIFWSINTKYTTNPINLIGRVYSCQVYDNGTLVRDLVPCINPSSVVGMYDIVNDAFYSSANNYNFIAGNPV